MGFSRSPAGGGYFRFIELITPKTTTAIRLSNISISSVVILSPPFFGEGKSAVLSRPVLLVSLEHVNMIRWVLLIVNDRDCPRLQFALAQVEMGISKGMPFGMLQCTLGDFAEQKNRLAFCTADGVEQT